ncbi:hypothetical protein ABPG75_013881 [Micractinium tetrahymenae]
MLGEGEWVDAQPFLAAVCAGMGVGELLHGETFSLFDSTTAIEIGDAKMDVGLNRNEEIGTAEELIAGGAAPASLPPRPLLAVMDRLLVLEATWHAGSMLPQTVFTSLYMLQPDRLSANAPLHAFCLALRSACSLCVDMAHAGSVTEDEDFFVHTFGIKMLDLPGDKPIKAALQALATAEEQLEQRLAAEQAEQLSEELAAALLARVRFRRLVLEALHCLQQYSQAGVEQARRYCQLAEAQLKLVADTASLAAPVEEAPGFVQDVNRRHMGLVPPRPVQALSFQHAVEHWHGLLRGLASALHSLLFVRGSWPALRATLVDFASKNHHSVVRSAMHLQLIKPLPPPPAPEAAAASAAKLLNGGAKAGGGGGKKPAAEVPSWCPGQQMVCREFGLSLAAVPSPEAALFIEQAAIAIQGMVYALCLNRCRQRRRLRRQLEDWRNIFDHGFNADVTEPWQRWLASVGWRWTYQNEGLLQGQGPGAAWAEREAACCALLHLQLGFPLELYAPHEMVQLYWYCNYLLGCQLHLTRLLHAGAPPPAPPKRGAAAGGRGRGGRGGGAAAAQRSAEEAAAARELEGLLLELERTVCQGMFHAAIALQQLGCIQVPATPFNTEEHRYEQRFGCLEILCRPELMPYEQFRASTDASGLPPARLLGVAAAAFARAAERAAGVLGAAQLRGLLRDEQVRHLEGLQRTATQNAVAAKLLTTTSVRAAAAAAGAQPGEVAGGAAAGAGGGFKATFDFRTALACSTAAFYPSIVLKH